MTKPDFFELWVYLSASPLLGLTLTLVAYQLAYFAYARAKFNPLANPVPIAIALIVAVLAATGTDYRTYFSLAVRSVTAPIAMGIAEKGGGVPALAAVFAIATGIIGAVSARFVLDACRIREPAARGFARGSPHTASAPRAPTRSAK